MEIKFDHIPKNMYIGNFMKNYAYPVCDFSKTKKDKYIPFPNTPASGFRFAPSSYGTMLIDPRGFAFHLDGIRVFNLLSNSTVVNGELIGEYRWIWKNDNFTIEKEEIVKTMDMPDEDAVMDDIEFNGDMCKVYKLPNGQWGVYLGRCYNIYGHQYGRSSISNIQYIGDTAVEKMVEYGLCSKILDITKKPDHLFVVFRKNGIIEYKQFSRFISFGDDGYSDRITPNNIDDYRKSIFIGSYVTNYSYYFLYDMSKYYCSIARKYKSVMGIVPDEDVEHIRKNYKSARFIVQNKTTGNKNAHDICAMTDDEIASLNILAQNIIIEGKKKQMFSWVSYKNSSL